MREFTFQGKDGRTIHTYCWVPKVIRGVLQIAHGMAETATRYNGFAKVLNEHGYAVYANDHRGHGKSSPSLDALGNLADANGFDLLVDDMHILNTTIQQEHAVPLFLLGHSMGSFAAQLYVLQFPETIDGLILSGSNGKQGPMLHLGKLVAKAEKALKGRKAKSPLLTNLTFGMYNKAFTPNRTGFDWLNRDESEVDAYIANPYCATTFPVGFYEDFFQGLIQLEKTDFTKVHYDFSTLIIAGDKDPVGSNIKELIERIKKMGKTDVKLYPDARHEILLETNRDEVYKDVIGWLNLQL